MDPSEITVYYVVMYVRGVFGLGSGLFDITVYYYGLLHNPKLTPDNSLHE